jgi:hypothetical protein
MRATWLTCCAAGLRLSSRQVKQLKQDDLAHCFESADTFFAAQQTRQLIQQLNTRLEAMQAFVLARCVPSDNFSNGKSKGKSNTRNGNRYLIDLSTANDLWAAPFLDTTVMVTANIRDIVQTSFAGWCLGSRGHHGE